MFICQVFQERMFAFLCIFYVTLDKTITAQQSSLYPSGKHSSLAETEESSENFIYSSSTQEFGQRNTPEDLSQNVIPSSVSKIEINQTQQDIFTSLGLHASKQPDQTFTAKRELLPSTEPTTLPASPQHTQLSLFDNEHQSSDWSDQIRATGAWHMEHTTALPHFSELASVTFEPYAGRVTTSLADFSDWTFRAEDDITTTSSTDSDRESSQPQSSSPPLDALTVVKLDDNSGYITTPYFQEGIKYPRLLNTTYCLSFNSSEGQGLLLSFQHFNLESSSTCRYDYLLLIEIETSNTSHTIWKKCGTQTLPFRIFNQSDICLQFVSDTSIEKSGFKASYSILPKTDEPRQKDNGFLDCSTITPSQRSIHFDCNFAIECSDRQDEMDCPYSSPECPGLIDSGSQCYTSVQRSNITWDGAREVCRNFNQTLASPNSHQEWQDFTRTMTGRNVVAYVGLRLSRDFDNLLYMYSKVWRWDTGSSAFYVHVSIQLYNWISVPACARFIPSENNSTLLVSTCYQTLDAIVLCQNDRQSPGQKPRLPALSQQQTTNQLNITTEVCSDGSLVRDFLSCDPESHCHDDLSQDECLALPSQPAFDLFQCLHIKVMSVHYTLVCDFRSDCADSSDESFCTHESCPEYSCQDGQCLSYNHRCDGTKHCSDGSDENCHNYLKMNDLKAIPPPAKITLDEKGSYRVVALNDSDTCPGSHVQCQDLFCLPSYLRCNGVIDCTDHEDEDRECETATCKGFFRCRGSKVCVHPENVCDGVFHCPQRDDEALCEMVCPQNCTCQGLAFACTTVFPVSNYPQLRFLEISGSDVSVTDLSRSKYLVLLRFTRCHLTSLGKFELSSLQNLLTLDLRDNALTHLDLNSLLLFPKLMSLVLSGNPLQSLIPASKKILTLLKIDLSHTQLSTIDNDTLAAFPSVRSLNFSNSRLTTVVSNAFSSTTDLRNLDFRCAPLTVFPMDMLRHLSSLRKVMADDFRLCCKSALPEDFVASSCTAPRDSIASCDDLLRSKVYRFFLWVMACTALLGNAGSFVSRYCVKEVSHLNSFPIFVTNLCMADFLMGVYLAMVGVADFVMQDQYWWRASSWKSSAACKTAGFLSLLSSEVSAFFICLITLDRFLVLHFPFSRIHFSRRSAVGASVVAWTMGLVLAAVPVLPWTEHWDFYGHTGICIPLPFARKDAFNGHMYSFGIMIVLNFILFIFIAVGQASIFWSVRSSSLPQIRKSTKSKDAAIARRLLTIVLSDFLCWFPVGTLGLLAYMGTPIRPEISVAVAIFVVPFNSALNPFLYTFNMLMEKRRKATEARILSRLQSAMQSEISSVGTPLKSQTKNGALIQIDTWLHNGLLHAEDVISLAQYKNAADDQNEGWSDKCKDKKESPNETTSKF